jgi:hypothetical protein
MSVQLGLRDYKDYKEMSVQWDPRDYRDYKDYKEMSVQ